MFFFRFNIQGLVIVGNPKTGNTLSNKFFFSDWIFKAYHKIIWISIFGVFFLILLIDGAMLEDGSKNVKPIFDGEQDWIVPVITKRNVERKFAEKLNSEIVMKRSFVT